MQVGGCKMTTTTSQVLIVGLALICCGGIFAEASIEKEPVKVTHRNSGPRYDIDDVERTRMSSNEADSSLSASSLRNNNNNRVLPPTTQIGGSGANDNNNNNGDEPTTVGHISIRRIFLVPMMPPPSQSDWQSSSPSTSSNERTEESNEEPTTSVFGNSANRPFWPLWPPSRHHMFGGDSASRSPSSSDNEPSASFGGEGSGSREVENNENTHRRNRPPIMSLFPISPSSIGGEPADGSMERPQRPPTMIDPIQMMINMMQEALNPASSTGGSNFFTDLNKEASANRPSGSSNDASSNEDNRGLVGPNESPFGRPTAGGNSKNETKEDIVEIDGKKYLRKTVINRHVGENIIFMTKRLIFTPLNETENNNFGGDSSTSIPSTTTNLPPSSEDRRKVEEATTTTTTASVPSSTEQVTSTTEQPTTTSSTTTTTTAATAPAATSPSSTSAEETTPKTNWVDRVSDAIDRAAERLVEKTEVVTATIGDGSTTTTGKPKPSV